MSLKRKEREREREVVIGVSAVCVALLLSLPDSRAGVSDQLDVPTPTRVQ